MKTGLINQKENFLFDLDGVVLDSMHYHALAVAEACEKFKVKITKEDVLLNEGSLTFDVMKKIFERSSQTLTKETYFEIFKLHKKFFIEKYSKFVKPFDEIYEILVRLKNHNKKLALVTGSDQEIVNSDLPKNIKELFDVIITADKINFRKPHPEPYQKAVSLLKATVLDSVAIENSTTGIAAAKNAGLFCIAVTTTLPKEYLSKADLILENHIELKRYIFDGVYQL